MIPLLTYKESTCWKITFNKDRTYVDKPSWLSAPNFREFGEFSEVGVKLVKKMISHEYLTWYYRKQQLIKNIASRPIFRSFCPVVDCSLSNRV